MLKQFSQQTETKADVALSFLRHLIFQNSCSRNGAWI